MITHSETLKWEKSLPVTVTQQGEKNANVKKLPSCILYFPRIWYTGVRVFQVALRCVGRIFPTGGIGRRVSPNQLKIGYSPLPGKITPPPFCPGGGGGHYGKLTEMMPWTLLYQDTCFLDM